MTKKYNWYDNLQYGAMLLMAAAMPVAWRFGLWTALLLALTTVVKMAAQRKAGNPTLDRGLRVALCAPVVYWLVLAASLLWTADLATGWSVLRLKAGLLIFPLCFLLSDTSYLTRGHLRLLGYALLLSLCGVFCYFAVLAGIKMSEGSTFASVTASGIFDTRHHAYIALYLTVAVLFVYHELATHWKAMKRWHRVLLIVALPLLVCYVLFVNSRAGVLALALTAVCCILHQMIHYRRWWQGAVVAIALVAAGASLAVILPGYQNRIASTLQQVQEKGDEGDIRIAINQASANGVLDNPVAGYGVGDYYPIFADLCREYGDGYTATNAHNQYMESLLAAGVAGLAAFLFFMLSPLAAAWRRRSGYLFPVAVATGIVMFNLLFESMLERQMGLLFIGALYAVMVLILSVEENKFGQSVKS